MALKSKDGTDVCNTRNEGGNCADYVSVSKNRQSYRVFDERLAEVADFARFYMSIIRASAKGIGLLDRPNISDGKTIVDTLIIRSYTKSGKELCLRKPI